MNPKRIQTQKRDLKLGIVTVAISLFFGLLVAEIVVRLFLPMNSPDTVREHSLEYVPAVYARHLLKPVGRLVDTGKEKAWGGESPDVPGDELYFISENGYRGPSFDVRNMAQKTRIIVLGGSAVFDQNVWDTSGDVKRTWPHVVEKHLLDRGFHDVEVINAGIPGHSSADSLGRLLSQLWIYEPDIVVVYQGWNDIKFWGLTPISPEQPMISFVPTYDARLNPFISYQGTLDRFLSHSQIYIKLRNRFYKWKIPLGSEGANSGTDTGIRVDTYSEYGPEQFRLNLESIVSASHSIGAKPVLISQATLVAADNTDDDIARIGFGYQNLSHAAMSRAFDETYDIIRRVAENTNTLMIDAATAMNGKSEYFGDHVHTSPAGSARLAQIVADELAVVLAGIKETKDE